MIPKDKELVVMTVSRDDLEMLGFDSRGVEKETMQTIADRWGEDLIQEFEQSVGNICDDMGLPIKSGERTNADE
jgi:hypothetical protein